MATGVHLLERVLELHEVSGIELTAVARVCGLDQWVPVEHRTRIERLHNRLELRIGLGQRAHDLTQNQIFVLIAGDHRIDLLHEIGWDGAVRQLAGNTAERAHRPDRALARGDHRRNEHRLLNLRQSTRVVRAAAVLDLIGLRQVDAARREVRLQHWNQCLEDAAQVLAAERPRGGRRELTAGHHPGLLLGRVESWIVRRRATGCILRGFHRQESQERTPWLPVQHG